MMPRRIVMLVSLASCSGPPVPDDFTFKVIQVQSGPDRVLHEAVFDSYQDGADAGSVIVSLLREDLTQEDHVVRVGLCGEVAECAGPLEYEEIKLSLESQTANAMMGYRCVGTLGSLTVGIDASGHGDCER